MSEIKAINPSPAGLRRAIEYALRHSPVTESVFCEEGDFDVEITDPASLEPFATTLINEVAPPMVAAALAAKDTGAVPPIAICFMIECTTTAQPGINIWPGGWDSASGVETRAWLRDNGLIDSTERATSRGRAWFEVNSP